MSADQTSERCAVCRAPAGWCGCVMGSPERFREAASRQDIEWCEICKTAHLMPVATPTSHYCPRYYDPDRTR